MLPKLVPRQKVNPKSYRWPPWIVFGGFLLFFVPSCSTLLPPATLDRVMESNGGTFYFYQDEELEISLRIGPGRLFDWHFKNKGNQKLVIPMTSLALRRQNDETDYALWGEPKKNLAEDGDLTLLPGGFANYSFPVRSKSPFWPFAPKEVSSYRLHFSVRWGYRDYQYAVGFEPLVVPKN